MSLFGRNKTASTQIMWLTVLLKTGSDDRITCKYYYATTPVFHVHLPEFLMYPTFHSVCTQSQLNIVLAREGHVVEIENVM